jgi:hypothetical protein
MKTITEKEATENPTLEQLIGKDSELKRWIVDYVGINSEEYIRDDEITVQMIVEVFSKEFPEFLLAVAEENWVRGYHQALEDVDTGRNAEFEEELQRGAQPQGRKEDHHHRPDRLTDPIGVDSEGNLVDPPVVE